MKHIYPILARYLISALLALNNLAVFYLIFTPLTIYPVYFILSLFFPVEIIGKNLLINDYSIELIDACIAGSAYYLLTILNLATPMKFKTRIYSLIFSFSLFLLINVLRISFFSYLFISGFSLFNLFHLIFWYALSILFVVGIWLLTIKLFKINKIPVYTDFFSIEKLLRI
ncbi:MAG: pacearchaeosortase [Nanoarchaeota archaeon]